MFFIILSFYFILKSTTEQPIRREVCTERYRTKTESIGQRNKACQFSTHSQHAGQSRTQSNACAQALGKLNFSCAVIGLTFINHACQQAECVNLGVPVVNFPRANAFLACAEPLLWERDCGHARKSSGPLIFLTI
jgi:hypothetical protein